MEQEEINPLIGRKVKGFFFEDGTDRISYQSHMDLYIGKVGLIIRDIKDGFIVKFQDNNTYCYPSSLIEQHIVEEGISEDFVDTFKYGIDFGVQYLDLKTEFLKIQTDSIGKPLTASTIEGIKRKYYELFNHFGLQDLQWTLIECENSIVLTPIRVIDEYTIKGILKYGN